MISTAFARYAAVNVDGLTLDEQGPEGNVFIEHMPSTPDLAVMVKTSGAVAQLTKTPSDLPLVQFLVRGEPNNFVTGWDLAYEIKSLFDCLDLATLDEGGEHELFVVSCTPVQSIPISIGLDENRRPEWSLNFQARVHAPTLHRSA